MKTQLLVISLIFISAGLANACLSFPKEVVFPGATFSTSPMSIGTGFVPEFGKKAAFFNHGSSRVFFNSQKNQWCFADIQKKPDDKSEPTCFKDTDKIVIDDENGKKCGVAEFKGHSLFLFSIDTAGKKDIRKPYLSITDSSDDKQLALMLKAYNQSQQVGEFTMTDSPLIMRSLDQGSAEKPFDINGHSIESSGSCKAKASVKDFSGSSSASPAASAVDSAK